MSHEKDTVNVLGVRADGSSEVIGTAPMPPKMKARELVTETFGSFQDDDGSDADLAMACCEQLIEYLGRTFFSITLSKRSADPTDLFMEEVRAELKRARAKFPGDRIMTIALAEEFGELCKAVLDEDAAAVRKEAVQTAVMAARVAIDGDGSVREWRAAKGLDAIGAPAQGAGA